MKRRVLSMMLAAVMCAAMLSGCGSDKTNGLASETQKEEAKETAESVMEEISNVSNLCGLAGTGTSDCSERISQYVTYNSGF